VLRSGHACHGIPAFSDPGVVQRVDGWSGYDCWRDSDRHLPCKRSIECSCIGHDNTSGGAVAVRRYLDRHRPQKRSHRRRLYGSSGYPGLDTDTDSANHHTAYLRGVFRRSWFGSLPKPGGVRRSGRRDRNKLYDRKFQCPRGYDRVRMIATASGVLTAGTGISFPSTSTITNVPTAARCASTASTFTEGTVSPR